MNRKKEIIIAIIMSAVSLALLIWRWFEFQSGATITLGSFSFEIPALFYLFINLLLGWIPLFLSGLMLQLSRMNHSKLLIIVFGLWIAFFPNAPYLATDLVHLTDCKPNIYWVDWSIFLWFILTGIYITLLSLRDVHRILEVRLPAFAVWPVLISCLFACGIGVWVGRVLRWYSWDIFLKPSIVLSDIFGRLFNGQISNGEYMLMFSVSGLLLALYTAFKPNHFSQS